MKALIFAAALAVASLFGFAPCAVAQDDQSTLALEEDVRMESVTLVGVTIPETGDAVIEYRRRGGEIRACPQKDKEVARYMATFKPGGRALMMQDKLESCPLADTK